MNSLDHVKEIQFSRIYTTLCDRDAAGHPAHDPACLSIDAIPKSLQVYL
jgi:hypothetical protein